MTRYYVRKSIRKWAFLEPWCAFLRDNAALEVEVDHKDDLLLCVRLRPEQRESVAMYCKRVVRLREALELLTMVAFVDTLAWQDLLRFKCACVRAPFWDNWRLPLGLWLKLGDAKDPEFETFDTLLYAAFFATNDSVSPAARMAMQSIVSEMTPAMHANVSARGRVDVCLRFVPPACAFEFEPARVNEYLASVLETARTCLAIAASTDPMVTADRPTAIDMDAQALQYMHKLVLTDAELHIRDFKYVCGTTALLADFVGLELHTIGFYPGLDVSTLAPLGTVPLTELAVLLRAITQRVSRANQRRVIHTSNNSTTNSVDTDTDADLALALAAASFAHIQDTSNVHTLQVDFTYARRMHALLSALSVSHCFDQLHFDHAFQNDCFRAKKWQWLAFALLSKDSQARVTKLSLSDVALRAADVHAIVSVLNVRDPVRKLAGLCRTARDAQRLEQFQALEPLDRDIADLPPFDADVAELPAGVPVWPGDVDDDIGRDVALDDDPDVRRYYADPTALNVDDDNDAHCPTYVVVRAGATVAIDPLNFERVLNARESFVVDNDTEYRVIQDDANHDWIGVLVPCFGFCTVQRIDIVRSVASTDGASNVTSFAYGYRGSIRSLRLAPGMDTELTTLLPLLQYLGNRLLELETSESLPVAAADVDAIVAACPHLRVLRVGMPRIGFEDALAAAFADERCRVVDLRLDDVRSSVEMLGFIHTLADPTTRLAQTLEKLTLYGYEESLDAAMLSALRAMLASNAMLAMLQIETTPQLAKEFKPLLMKHHGEAIAREQAPLPLACRLAFLSVVQSRGSVVASDEGAAAVTVATPPMKRQRVEVTVPKIEQLDRGVTTLIFQLAAERMVRRIRISEAEEETEEHVQEVLARTDARLQMMARAMGVPRLAAVAEAVDAADTIMAAQAEAEEAEAEAEV